MPYVRQLSCFCGGGLAIFWSFYLNLIHLLFDVAMETVTAVSMSFTYAHMYMSLLYSACFDRRDGSRAGKEKGLTQAGGDTQVRGGLLRDFKPHKVPAQQPGERSDFQL